jgi:hypothetical protein
VVVEVVEIRTDLDSSCTGESRAHLQAVHVHVHVDVHDHDHVY